MTENLPKLKEKDLNIDHPPKKIVKAMIKTRNSKRINMKI